MLRQALANSNKPPIFHKPNANPEPNDADDGPTQLPWSNYFDTESKVNIPGTDNWFQVYQSGPRGPGATFVLLHGCGLSALSWALVAGALRAEHRVVAFDFRAHGLSVSSDDSALDAATLVDDTIALLATLFGSETEAPALVLVGHSMGGAIATRVADSGRVRGVVGLVVVDVVEGTALAALGSMQAIISKRPSSFASLSKAIDWALASETVRNRESARVSIPSQLKQREDDKWIWRTDLARTEAHWAGWFTQLSDAFLRARAARLLMLAGTDRLDRALTVGQMQGKFQLVVLPAVGHLVQEDAPGPTAAALIAFATRNQFGKPLTFPPKPFPAPVKPPQVT